MVERGEVGVTADKAKYLAEYRARKAWSCTCSRCGVEFLATKQTELKARKGGNVYCTPVCLSAAISAARTTFAPQERNCATCGTGFVATSDNKERKYCSFDCYAKDPVLLEAKRKKGDPPWLASARARKSAESTVTFKCEQCGEEQERPRGRAKLNRFCSRACYRHWFAQRFDKWVSNPRTIGKLQGFDEYLTQENLQCLIDGCNWRGLHLGKHLNIHHGILPEDFKRAVGFNNQTGLVPAHISKELSERNKALGLGNPDIGALSNPNRNTGRKFSAETQEHRTKSALAVWERKRTDQKFMTSLSRRLSRLARKRWAEAKAKGRTRL